MYGDTPILVFEYHILLLWLLILYRERRMRLLNLLQEAGDVVLAACGPGEGVGVGSDVRCHQLSCLMAFGPAGVPNSIVVHSKAVRQGTHEGAGS